MLNYVDPEAPGQMAGVGALARAGQAVEPEGQRQAWAGRHTLGQVSEVEVGRRQGGIELRGGARRPSRAPGQGLLDRARREARRLPPAAGELRHAQAAVEDVRGGLDGSEVARGERQAAPLGEAPKHDPAPRAAGLRQLDR